MSRTKAHKILSEALLRLVRDGWCDDPEAIALNAKGKPVQARNPSAVKWDPNGALWASTKTLSQYIVVRDIMNRHTLKNHGATLYQLNINWRRDQKKMLGVFRRAIRELKEEIDGTQGET